jgi:hypothetical protein
MTYLLKSEIDLQEERGRYEQLAQKYETLNALLAPGSMVANIGDIAPGSFTDASSFSAVAAAAASDSVDYSAAAAASAVGLSHPSTDLYPSAAVASQAGGNWSLARSGSCDQQESDYYNGTLQAGAADVEASYSSLARLQEQYARPDDQAYSYSSSSYALHSAYEHTDDVDPSDTSRSFQMQAEFSSTPARWQTKLTSATNTTAPAANADAPNAYSVPVYNANFGVALQALQDATAPLAGLVLATPTRAPSTPGTTSALAAKLSGSVNSMMATPPVHNMSRKHYPDPAYSNAYRLATSGAAGGAGAAAMPPSIASTPYVDAYASYLSDNTSAAPASAPAGVRRNSPGTPPTATATATATVSNTAGASDSLLAGLQRMNALIDYSKQISSPASAKSHRALHGQTDSYLDTLPPPPPPRAVAGGQNIRSGGSMNAPPTRQPAAATSSHLQAMQQQVLPDVSGYTPTGFNLGGAALTGSSPSDWLFAASQAPSAAAPAFQLNRGKGNAQEQQQEQEHVNVTPIQQYAAPADPTAPHTSAGVGGAGTGTAAVAVAVAGTPTRHVIHVSKPPATSSQEHLAHLQQHQQQRAHLTPSTENMYATATDGDGASGAAGAGADVFHYAQYNSTQLQYMYSYGTTAEEQEEAEMGGDEHNNSGDSSGYDATIDRLTSSFGNMGSGRFPGSASAPVHSPVKQQVQLQVRGQVQKQEQEQGSILVPHRASKLPSPAAPPVHPFGSSARSTGTTAGAGTGAGTGSGGANVGAGSNGKQQQQSESAEQARLREKLLYFQQQHQSEYEQQQQYSQHHQHVTDLEEYGAQVKSIEFLPTPPTTRLLANNVQRRVFDARNGSF